MEQFDLVVLGAGPAGHFGAIQAAKSGHRVAVIEAERRVGGASATTGTIPSKALREATIHLTGLRQRYFYGGYYRVKDRITVQDLTVSTEQIVQHETEVLHDQLTRNNVEIITGLGSFIAPDQVVAEGVAGVRLLKARKVLVAVGSRPARPPGVEFDGRYVLDSNQILNLQELPKRLIVVGAGVIGVEYACIFAALGVPVTLINQSSEFLGFVDREINDILRYQMITHNVDFRLGEEVVDIRVDEPLVTVRTASNKAICGDAVLYSVGRQGNTDHLGLDAAGLVADGRGRLKVNSDLQTEVEHIYAAGDVIGFPSLAATSREQGRRAASRAFGIDYEPTVETDLPFGIYAIPEISMVGSTEAELTEKRIPYEVGRARYREIARAHIVGDTSGMLKLLFDPTSLQLLGVHIVGEGATELIHIGQTVKALGGTLQYFVDAVFNFPTLAECYKVAALDGINRAKIHAQALSVEASPVESS